MAGEDDSSKCYPLLYLNNTYENWNALVNNLKYNDYDVDDYTTLLNGTNDSEVYYMPSIVLDDSDARSETVHTQDSGSLLVILLLLFLTVITIWVFKVRRFRVLHETGLAMLYGVIIGVILHYGFPSSSTKKFYLATDEECNDTEKFQVADRLLLSTEGDEFICTVDGKVFKNNKGDRIEQSLLFDPELFFFVLLPPIIFYAGYSLKKQHFFRNIGSLLMYAFAGTTISCFVVGALMFGWVLSGIDSKISELADRNGVNIPATPDSFKESIIPSLLFGSLISATDPVTVLAIFHDLHVDHDLYSLVFGESVMNDAVAIVLYRSVDEYNGDANNFNAGALFKSIGSFVGIFLGSFILGCVMGIITALLMKFSKLREFPLLETAMFIIMSYGTFVLAELMGLTGIVAVLFVGIMQSYYTYINLSHESRRRTKEVFELLNFFAENFVFSYMGLSLFTFRNHQWVPGFITFSFIAIFAGRVINIYVLSFLLNLGRSKKIGFRFQHMLVFAGLRGAIAFALAIRNTQSEERQLIFTATLVIVMTTVLICGGFTTLALQCLKIKVGVEDDCPELNEDGEEIPYDSSKGNYFISKFATFDKKYLVPLFTHRGRPLNEFCPSWCGKCISLCYKCKPDHDKLIEESTDDLSSSDSSSEEEDEDDGKGNIMSFRDSDFTHSQYHDDEEGDIGLGSEQRRHKTDESSL